MAATSAQVAPDGMRERGIPVIIRISGQVTSSHDTSNNLGTVT